MLAHLLAEVDQVGDWLRRDEAVVVDGLNVAGRPVTKPGQRAVYEKGALVSCQC